jgi:hypothetical protein
VAGETRGAEVEEGKKAEHWLAACRMRRTTMGKGILHMTGWLGVLTWTGLGHLDAGVSWSQRVTGGRGGSGEVFDEVKLVGKRTQGGRRRRGGGAGL